jgi:ABC-type lipoprotein release transport system permease subunit
VIADLKDVPMAQPNEPALYFPASQFPFRAMFLAVDAADAPTAVAALRAALRATAPGIPLTDTRTWADRFRARSAEPRLLMGVLVAFGGLAAALAALGVYGLFSWMVALRTRELAIRLTLGAPPASLCALVVRQGALLAGCGMIAGWAAVRGAERLLAPLLFQVSPGDLSSALAAAALLLTASVAACLPPALRAMRVDPIEGLRVD